MSDPLYRRGLLRLAADAYGAGRLPAPNATGTAFNPACGDRVTVELVLKDGSIEAMRHETRACVLAQASASILGSSLKGANRELVERLHAQVRAMLANVSQAPGPPFSSYTEFSGAVEYESRHRCVLLPIEAVLTAFDDLDR